MRIKKKKINTAEGIRLTRTKRDDDIISFHCIAEGYISHIYWVNIFVAGSSTNLNML